MIEQYLLNCVKTEVVECIEMLRKQQLSWQVI